MNIPQRITAGYLVLFLLSCMTGTLGVYSVLVIRDAFTALSEETLHVIAALEDLRFTGLRLVSSTRGAPALSSGHTAAPITRGAARGIPAARPAPKGGRSDGQRGSGVARNVAGAGTLRQAVARYRVLALEHYSQSELDSVSRIEKTAQGLIDAARALVDLGTPGVAGQALAESRQELAAREHAFLRLVSSRLAREQVELGERRQEIYSRTNAAIEGMTVVAGIMLLLAIVLARSNHRRIAGPLSALAEAARRIALRRYDVPVDDSATDEFGALARAFNQMARDLDRSTVSREFLRNIFNSMKESLIVLGPTGEIQSVNRAAAELLGYREDELLDRRDISTLITGGATHDSTHDGPVSAALAGQAVEATIHTNDGRCVAVMVSGARLAEDDSSPPCAVLILQDISERKRAERDLVEARLRAEAADRMKSEFLATMSHEIRTPMNGVLGMTELLLGSRLDDKQRRFVETIGQSGRQLLALINDILDFSKIEAGKLELDNAPFDLREFIDDIGEQFAVQAHKKGLDLACCVAPDVASRYRGDAARLRQVLSNLLSNALKFTEAGEVVLRVRPGGSGAQARMLMFEVRDTGVGMSDEAQSHVFDAFAQADKSTTRRYGGTGLGLAICRRLVALMGGQIGVQSRVGAGSRFWFTASLETVETEPGEVESFRQALGRLRVLVVDGNASTREGLGHLLARWGIGHACVGDGAGAVACLRDARAQGAAFDVVLLDQQLPGQCGIEVARTIRAEPGSSAVRLVMLSRLLCDGEGGSRPSPDIDGYLSKPVRQSDLYDCLAGQVGTSARDCAAREASAVSAPAALAEPVRVLIAEDNPVNQELVKEMIGQMGCEAALVKSGVEVLAALDRQHYDLVLMDCQMPRMDGFEATREHRRREVVSGSVRRLPIIALTANAIEGDRERCLLAGMDDYLSKPFTFEQLRAVLLRWGTQCEHIRHAS